MSQGSLKDLVDVLSHYLLRAHGAGRRVVLVVDDFGRQHCTPRDLLNRWIVPLETGHDYLTLQTGLKFDILSLIHI